MNCQRSNCMRKCVDQDPQYPAGIGKLSRETGVAFARSYVGGVETAIAFAGAKWVFLACFSVAEVLSVSTVVVDGRAKAMAVSCWPASAVAEVSLVSISPRRCALCAKKFALLGPVRTRARNSSPCVVLRKAQNWRFMACWASFFAKIIGERCRAAGVASMPGTTRGSGQARRP